MERNNEDGLWLIERVNFVKKQILYGVATVIYASNFKLRLEWRVLLY